MAIRLSNARVKAGRLIPVYNTDRPRFSNAKPVYMSVWVEDADGKNERCLLFTEKELERAENRADRNVEDQTSKDWWINATD